MTRPDPRGPRLDLVLLSPELLDAFIAGDRARARELSAFTFPDEFPGEALDLLVLRRDQLAAQPSWQPWLLRAIVLRSEQLMVGYANFHGPPGINDTGEPDAAEIGYTIFAEHHNRGIATETARAMIDWARAEHGVTHFLSGIAPDNAPSLRVIEKLGFTRTELVVDGEIIFERRLP